MLSYVVRESRRARRVLLKVDPCAGLIVVVPPGYDRDLIAPLLKEHANWIRAAMPPGALRSSPDESSYQLPRSISLAASGERLAVVYQETGAASVAARESPSKVQLSGAIDDPAACRQALRRWLLRRARRDLLPLLTLLAGETGLGYSDCSIRLQRSRWGSCSPKLKISLNASLLFLPPHLVRYVLVHELCHTRHLDHSRRFWSLVARHEPLHKDRRRELAALRYEVPGWVHERPPVTEVGTVVLWYA